MPVDNLKVTVAQLNPVVGDIVGNAERIREIYFDAEERGRDLVVTPALSVTGHPLGNLVDDPDFLDAVDAALAALRRATRGGKTALAVGAPLRDAAGVRNAAVVFRSGETIKIAHGEGAPNRGASFPFDLDGAKIGVLACEDDGRSGVWRELRDNGAEIIVSTDAGPFRPDILETRVREIAAERVAETGLPQLYVNSVGGQDETVFNGGSFLLDRDGVRILQLPEWEECIVDHDFASREAVPEDAFPDTLESIYRAMMLGLADYVRKSGFTDVVLGLSGGMDSALAAAVAGDCLGAEHVHCVRLPSKHTADLSNRAAREMCEIWGFSMDTLPIGEVTAAAAATLEGMFPDGLKKLTGENMQARARGYLLMTVSNDRGWLLLSTGNKSEISVGYATLYGDMCGGYNPLKDVFKTTVFELAKWRNRSRPEGLRGPGGVVIPVEIIERPPSAELSPGQRDTDSLPPYPVLDAILEAMLEMRQSVGEIAAQGFDREMVERVHRMFRRAEYKRRQGAPGPAIGRRALARERRAPIVNRFDASMIATLEKMETTPCPK